MFVLRSSCLFFVFFLCTETYQGDEIKDYEAIYQNEDNQKIDKEATLKGKAENTDLLTYKESLLNSLGAILRNNAGDAEQTIVNNFIKKMNIKSTDIKPYGKLNFSKDLLNYAIWNNLSRIITSNIDVKKFDQYLIPITLKAKLFAKNVPSNDTVNRENAGKNFILDFFRRLPNMFGPKTNSTENITISDSTKISNTSATRDINQTQLQEIRNADNVLVNQFLSSMLREYTNANFTNVNLDNMFFDPSKNASMNEAVKPEKQQGSTSAVRLTRHNLLNLKKEFSGGFYRNDCSYKNNSNCSEYISTSVKISPTKDVTNKTMPKLKIAHHNSLSVQNGSNIRNEPLKEQEYTIIKNANESLETHGLNFTTDTYHISENNVTNILINVTFSPEKVMDSLNGSASHTANVTMLSDNIEVVGNDEFKDSNSTFVDIELPSYLNVTNNSSDLLNITAPLRSDILAPASVQRFSAVRPAVAAISPPRSSQSQSISNSGPQSYLATFPPHRPSVSFELGSLPSFIAGSVIYALFFTVPYWLSFVLPLKKRRNTRQVRQRLTQDLILNALRSYKERQKSRFQRKPK